MKREEVKREISRAIIVGIAAVMSMSLFACKPKEKVEKIEIPLEQSVNSNETKAFDNTATVQATLGKVRNYEAEKLLPSGTAEREKQVWTKRNHKWAEPPEEDKIYNKDNKNEAWYSAYIYNGNEYWISGANKLEKRIIYKKTSNDWSSDINATNARVAVIDGKESAPYSQILAEVSLSENISKNMRGNADTINITR